MDNKCFNTIYFGTVNCKTAIEMQAKGIIPLVIYEENTDKLPEIKNHITLATPFWTIPDSVIVSAYKPHEDDNITAVMFDDELLKIKDIIYTDNGATLTLSNDVIIDMFDEISSELADKEIHINKKR